jgi:outer membrane protein assembly factor BamB
MRRHRCAAILAVLIVFIAVAMAAAATAGRAVEEAAVRLLWRTAVDAAGDAPSTTPATDGRRLFLVTSTVAAYSLATGEPLWYSPLHRYVPRRLLAGRGMVFVPEATVAALDAATGRPVWEFTPDANTSLGRAAVDERALYVGTSSHRLYALRLADGRPAWVTDLGPGWTLPAVVRGVAVAGESVYATVEQWRAPRGKTASGWLIALSARDGTVRWRYHTGDGAERRGLSSTPVLAGGLVLAADDLGNAVVAVDRRTGREVWRFAGKPGSPGFADGPVVDGATVYGGSGDTSAYALALDTGRLLWQRQLPGSIGAYALCGGSLLANYQGLAVLDRQSGAIAGLTHDGEADFISSGFAVDANRAFVAGPKAIYAFSCR